MVIYLIFCGHKRSHERNYDSQIHSYLKKLFIHFQVKYFSDLETVSDAKCVVKLSNTIGVAAFVVLFNNTLHSIDGEDFLNIQAQI